MMDTTTAEVGGAVQGAVRWWLRIEGVVILATAIYLFAEAGGSWRIFALWFMVPDVSILAYAAGPRVGAAFYNATHCYIVPLLLAVALIGEAGVAFPLIWVAHIALDRAFGFGLKYPTAFRDTHLGRMGRSSWRI